jgi:hypothetical protein
VSEDKTEMTSITRSVFALAEHSISLFYLANENLEKEMPIGNAPIKDEFQNYTPI